ncbi:MAG: glycosyltransferase family 39 protein [Acidiphilium sp.]|nr:glycosyltransferase family 39 protein [Acidiphilium sp.]MDD4934740.1 glycosyltransferase family 39 protein [Acidiphilium sp.]
MFVLKRPCSKQKCRTAAALTVATLILVIVAWLRSGEYDEYYSTFLIAGDPRPHWPTIPVMVAALRGFYHGQASFIQIAQNLRHGDVHPPLYFWLLSLWRDAFGMDLVRLRLLSILLTSLALASLTRMAQRFGVSAPLAIMITILCYGFAYTGIVARNFALADAFSLTGVMLLLEADECHKPAWGLLAGLLLGAACFSNYLASFTTIAALGWIALNNWHRPALWLMPALGAALFIPAGAWFFLAQAGTRSGQFHRFRLGRALLDLIRDQAGAILGALPRYAAPPWSVAIETLLGIFAVVLTIVVIRTGLPSLTPRHRRLVISMILAPPLGLLALGAIFNNTPIEVRYVWLGLPYIGLGLAAGLRRKPWLTGTLIAIQAAAIIGLAIAPQTMQPAARTVRLATEAAGPRTLVLVPFGNDGVGIPGPFIAASPNTMTVRIVRTVRPALLSETAPFHRAIIANITVDDKSRALIPQLDALFKTSNCWRQDKSPTEIIVFANHCPDHRD